VASTRLGALDARARLGYACDPMRAIRYHEHGGPEVLRVEELPDPVPAPGELAVRVRAISVSPINWKVAGTPGRGKAPPMIPGSECAGETADGRRVVLAGGGFGSARDGVYAERICARPELLVEVPAGVELAEAASLGVAYCTAWLALLERAGMKAGDRVAVLGATGGVGLAAMQIAKLRGAATVVGVARASAHPALGELGVERLLEDTREDLGAAILEATGGGADVIIDPVAGGIGARALGGLRAWGRQVVIGNAAGEQLGFPVAPFYGRCGALLGFTLFMYGERLVPTMTALLAAAAAGTLKVPIDRRFPLAQAADAWRYAQQRGKLGKVILEA